MNRFHRRYCKSGRWSETLEQHLLPWVIGPVDLGDSARQRREQLEPQRLGRGDLEPPRPTEVFPSTSSRLVASGREPYSPFQLGARFSANARGPSTKSLLFSMAWSWS